MSALPPLAAEFRTPTASTPMASTPPCSQAQLGNKGAQLGNEGGDQFVVSHGKCGAVGVFTASAPVALCRGQVVVIQTERGLELGTVLRPASLLQARLLGATSSGTLLHPLTPDDETRRVEQGKLEQVIFDTCQAWRTRDSLGFDILDIELLFDGAQAIVQFVGPDADTAPFAQALERHFGLTIRMQNLAHKAPPDGEDHAHGCDKPDCGRTAEGGSGCTTCSSGGCGSSAKVDMRDYFSHLRTTMESERRIPLA